MKKRFASYLCMGKAVALPFFFNPGNASAAELGATPPPSTTQPGSPTGAPPPPPLNLNSLLGQELHLIEMEGPGINLLESLRDAPDSVASAYSGGPSARIIIPDSNCGIQAQNRMNVVITGLTHGEDVFLMASSSKVSTGTHTSIGYPQLRLGLADFRVVSRFKFQLQVPPGGPQNSIQGSRGLVMVHVNLTELHMTPGTPFYLQVATGTSSAGAFSNIRFSELDEIEVVQGTCQPGGSAYGGGAY